MNQKENRPVLRLDHLLHGGDYNPDQWLHKPEVLDEDFRLMELANCNVASLGIFAWAKLEPNEGEFHFNWLDGIMDRFADRGWKVALATPTAAVPFWMTRRWPEIMRVTPDRRRLLPGDRVKYCLTTPILREKIHIINGRLADRYADHPALLLWHVSNEYGHYDADTGCHCDLCQQAFREWLKDKYEHDLDRLNHAWWSAFWSQTYMDWEEIESPAPHGVTSIHGLQLDWRRFVTDQSIEFMRNELGPLRELTPAVPVTTNLMESFKGLDYWKLARELDVVSWDSYPTWHRPDEAAPGNPDVATGARFSFHHDLKRSLGGGRPFLLMESTPSATNWQPVAKLKRPGMHMLSSLQAVAHGSDSVMYFQWRKGRGGFEKFHGAVVDHAGQENTRVFQDVAEVGKALKELADVAGARTTAETAILLDWENWWAIEYAAGPRIENKDYWATCIAHYRPFWNLGIPVDMVNEDSEFSRYRLLVAPMLYMLRPGVAERLERFVRNGGCLICTYWSGIADEDDLVFTGGFPGPLRRLLGIWSEEIDALYPGERNSIAVNAEELGLKGSYECRELCDLVHAESAQVLGTYEKDFYAGRPALTVNSFGKGEAYYVASRNEQRFTQDFLEALSRKYAIRRHLETELPEGVTVQTRQKDDQEYLFVMNFTPRPQQVDLPKEDFTALLNGQIADGQLKLEGYGVAVLQRQIAR